MKFTLLFLKFHDILEVEMTNIDLLLKESNMENLITVLNSLGFTENEAKIYISLLKTGPQNGYEISKSSGVPRSKIYVLLERLLQRGILTSSHNGKNVIYKAEPVSRLEDMATLDLQRNLQALRKETSKISETGDDDQIWHLSGYDNILLRVEEMIRTAEHELLIQIWQPELMPRIEQAILAAEDTIKIAVILYDETQTYQTDVKNVYKHGFEDNLLDENNARWLTCVKDASEMIYVTIPNIQQATAIHTTNKSMIWFSTEYVKHDVFCLRLIDDMGELAHTLYGPKIAKLRDIYTLQ